MASLWCQQIERFSALLSICAGNPLITVDSPHNGTITWILMLLCCQSEQTVEQTLDWPVFYRRHVDRSPHKGQWRGALIFSLIYAWTNGWVNNRDAGYLRRYRAHYDVTVMAMFVKRHRVLPVQFVTVNLNLVPVLLKGTFVFWICKVIIDDKSALVQQMAWCRQATTITSLPEPMWAKLRDAILRR